MISREEWRNLCKRYGFLCLGCGQKPKKLTKDHIIPVSLGGKDHISNIQPLCARCNSLKGNTIRDYRENSYRFEMELPDRRI